jgi:hypothetical protein
MRYIMFAVCWLAIVGVMLLWRWHHKFLEEDKIRRSLLTQEERDEEDFQEWVDRQW